MNRTTPLKRTQQPLRRCPLQKVSKRQARAQQVVWKTYKAIDGDDRHCAACGCSHDLTHSHVLTQKQHPQHRANPLNIVTLCWPCHCTWENNKRAFKRDYPDAFALKMERMQAIDPQAYAFFRMKNPTLFPPES